MASDGVPDDAPRPRLCHVRKWDDFQGYGFNLHAEKGKAGQYIGKVDPGSPAEFAGLKEGDRIVEVNGTNISNENHQQVVQRVKAVPDETKMLVLDAATEEYYRNLKIVVRGDMPNVEVLSAPERNPNSGQNNISAAAEEAREERGDSSSEERVVQDQDDQGTDHPHRPRLCYIKTWADFQGYGFNLHAEKNKPGQFIGKVDPGSPSEAAGLRQNDRIIEVNGQNVMNDSHQAVVTLIKSVPNETKLLVIDADGDAYFRERNIVFSSSSEFVDRKETPDSRPTAAVVEAIGDHSHKARLVQLATWSDYNGYGFNMHSIKGKEGEYIGKVEVGSPAFVAGLKEGDRVVEVGGDNVEKASHHDVVQKIKAANGRASMLIVDSEADAFFSSKGITVNGSMADIEVSVCPDSKPQANGTSGVVSAQVERPTPVAPPIQQPASPKNPVVVGGIEFAGSVEEARRKMSGKKRDLQHQMSAKEKYDLFQRL